MKKLRILVPLIILAFSFSVEAKVAFKISGCTSTEIKSGESITCDGKLTYEDISINDIDLEYETNLDIKIEPQSGFTVNDDNGKVSIHTDEALYDKILASTKVIKITLTSKSESNNEETLTLKNIKINKSDEIEVSDVSKKFTVIVPVQEEIKSSVCTLDSITIEGVKLTGFDKDKLEYRGLTVTNTIITIDAVRTHEKSSAYGLGNERVPKGETIEHDITVKAEDGTTKVYKLYITNLTPKEEIALGDESTVNEEKSSDNTLKSLELYNGKNKIDFKFDKEKDEYDIKLEDSIEKITIKAILNSDKASFVKDYGPRDIKIKNGNNKVLIKVKAENSIEKTITLNINYEDNRNSDTKLESIKINSQEVDLTKDKYEIKLPNDVIKTIIEVVASDEKATVNYEDIELSVGDNNVNITVTAEDGTIEEYDVNVIREDSKTIFERFEVVGYNINFSKDKTSYDLKVNKETDEIEIKVYPNNIDFEVKNNKNLRNGSKVEIKVTDDDGEHEYVIHIEKESIVLNIVCYAIFGIGVVAVIFAIVQVIKKKKKHKKVLNVEEI